MSAVQLVIRPSTSLIHFDFQRSIMSSILPLQDPEDLIEILQFKEFEKLGIQGHFGVGQLRHLQKQFSQDPEAMGALMMLVNSYVLSSLFCK